MSSIVKKLFMSITGAAMVLFLTFHAVMNIFVVISPNVYDAICHFLGANWYALIATMGLAALFLLHILFAFVLTVRNYIARGNVRYAVNKRPKDVEWSSQNMLALGVIILGFLVLHLFNFWYKMQLQELIAGINGEELHVAGAALVQGLFANNWYCIVYIIWMVALWFHLSHGIWSSMQSIGWNNLKWMPRLKCISNIYATIVCGLFAFIPVYYLICNIFAC
ncbi:MAG: succinate dehydrogenase cytochrome b subunit [Bacteroidales bacterium]|nr:succinate dehydrogenase cytochrome b subunit [Bacteroidales bacterium]